MVSSRFTAPPSGPSPLFRLGPWGLLLLLTTACGSPPSTPDGAAADAATGAPPSIEQAMASFRANDPAAAAEVLVRLVAEEPTNDRAWSMLGRARRQSGDLPGAREAWRKAVDLNGERYGALYGLSAVHALEGNPEAALDGLEALRRSNAMDLSQLPLDGDFSSLFERPRFQALLPQAEDFADSFVEPTRILQRWDGEATNDQFGWIARNIGDVDGDGIADLTTSAPNKTLDGGQNAGRVYAYSGASGKLLWSRDGAAGDLLGQGIEAAGDVDGDGIPDVVAGAPGADRVDVYAGNDGRTLLTVEGADGESFGRKVSDLGDLDGDGHDDILVGAPASNANGEGSGRALVISGSDGSTLIEWHGEGAGHRFGASGAGRVDGERTVLLVGAPDAGEGQRGRTYVYDGSGADPKFILESDPDGAEQGGMFVSVVGDVDADGVADLYSSDWSHGANGSQRGRVYVYSGVDGRVLLTLSGETDGDGFGIGPADAGDVDGDGHDDLIIGAWQQDNAAPSGGKVYLYSGKDGSLMDAWTCRVMGDTFGFDATGMGDVDGDGTIDFLLTSAWSAVSGPKSGRMFLIAGEG